jgi:transcriptional regulator with XRE-family HTH domain
MSDKYFFLPEKNFREMFSSQVAKAIDASGKERQQVAKAAKITPGSITGYCQGDYVPNFYVAYKIAKVLNINLHQLAEGAEPPPPEYDQLKKIFDRMTTKICDGDSNSIEFDGIKTIPESIQSDPEKMALLRE